MIEGLTRAAVCRRYCGGLLWIMFIILVCDHQQQFKWGSARATEPHLRGEPELIRASHLDEPPAVNPDTSAAAVNPDASSNRHVNHVMFLAMGREAFAILVPAALPV